MKKVIVKQPKEKEEQVPVEILAGSIREISAAIKRLRKGSLGEKALLMLIAQNCRPIGKRYPRHKVSTREVKEVMNSMETLERMYLRT